MNWPPGRGVWVTGPSRSGTSLVAGLLEAHGVFFGRCVRGDEHNPKGYFEHPELIRRIDMGTLANWPDRWWEVMRSEGYQDGQPWGVKRGPQAWPWVRLMFPNLIVYCKRPKEQVLASRLRRWPEKKGRHGQMFRETRKRVMDVIEDEASCPVVTVQTDKLVQGDYSRFRLALKSLHVEFDAHAAREWIDPSIWCRGMKR